MSFNGSEKEFLFTLYLKMNKEIMEDVLHLNLQNIRLEKHYQRMKIDMFGIDANSGVNVFIENLLLKSNGTHQSKIASIIRGLKEKEQGIIVYQAMDFHERHIEEIRTMIRDSRRKIRFYAVKINPDVLPVLARLNDIHKLKVYENLRMLDDVQNPIKIIAEFGDVTKKNTGQGIAAKSELDLTKRQNINEYILCELRRKSSCYLPLHREKANLDTNRILTIGGGRSGIQYFLSPCDRRYRAFVELRFTGRNSYVYQAIENKEPVIREKIGREVVFRDNKIGVYFKPRSDIKETVRCLVYIFKSMIQTFADYIFHHEDKERMSSVG